MPRIKIPLELLLSENKSSDNPHKIGGQGTLAEKTLP